MSNSGSPPVEDVIAVVGENATLLFESTEAFSGSVQITFTVSKLDPGGAPVPQASWSEEHTPILQASGAALQRFSSDWAVSVALPDLRAAVAIITFTVRGRSVSGAPLAGRALNRLRVPGIAVTSDANLQKVMLHEFFTPSGADFVFDRAKVQAIVDGLTIAQRKLLASYDLGTKTDRLVVFITLQPSPLRRMYADACRDTPTSVHANATFSAFHSKGKGNLTTLLCHTDNMVVNMVNPDTRRLFSSNQGRLSPDKWLSDNNPKPPKFLVGSHVAHFTDSVVWSRIFTSKGVDVMPGNSMHGIINTVGCWMLFRNYNWPAAKRDEFFRIYAALFRMKKPVAQIHDALVAAGYNSAQPKPDPPPTTTGSGIKYLYCDLNYAYSFFFRYVVGIDFFSNTNTFYSRFANLYKTHGMSFESSFPLSEIPGGYLYHDVDMRRKEDKTFQPGPAQWINNAAGFKTASNFLPDATWKNDINAQQRDTMTWADVYLYKPEGVSLQSALASPVSTTVP